MRYSILFLASVWYMTAPFGNAEATPFEPSLRTEMDGTVVAEVVVPTSKATVRRLLTDDTQAIHLSDEVLDVHARPIGNCSEVNVLTKGGISPIRYLATRCPTSSGWQTSLVESDDLSDLYAEWRLTTAEDEHTRVEYRLRTQLKGPVPKVILQRYIRRSAEKTLRTLVEKLGLPLL